MKTSTKRALIFTAVMAVFVGLHWLSGEPFERSPGVAYFYLCALVIATFMSAHLFLD